MKIEPSYKGIVSNDFDRIALLPGEKWNANNHYDSILLKNIPDECDRILEVGCGTGNLCNLLAEKSNEVIGIDASPKMISIAKEQNKCRNIHYVLGDYLKIEYPGEHFDCIISVATVHHLPMEAFLTKVKKELKRNCRLIILDLYHPGALTDYFFSAIAFPISKLHRLFHNHRLISSKEHDEIWKKHGQRDSYLTLNQVSELSEKNLKGAKIRRLLFWRYSLIWTK